MKVEIRIGDGSVVGVGDSVLATDDCGNHFTLKVVAISDDGFLWLREGSYHMVRSHTTLKVDHKEFLKAVDRVCIECLEAVEDSSVCERCPVRKTVDRLESK